MSFARQRPAGALDRGSPVDSAALIAGDGISRRQLEIQVRKDALLVKNIGRCPLRINGIAVSQALVRPRDTIHLRNQLILYCCWRPLELPPLLREVDQIDFELERSSQQLHRLCMALIARRWPRRWPAG